MTHCNYQKREFERQSKFNYLSYNIYTVPMCRLCVHCFDNIRESTAWWRYQVMSSISPAATAKSWKSTNFQNEKLR